MNTQQDSRKILEDLNFKKQQLQKGLPIVSIAPISPEFLANFKFLRSQHQQQQHNLRLSHTSHKSIKQLVLPFSRHNRHPLGSLF
jgi:hypothetical protein